MAGQEFATKQKSIASNIDIYLKLLPETAFALVLDVVVVFPMLDCFVVGFDDAGGFHIPDALLDEYFL